MRLLRKSTDFINAQSVVECLPYLVSDLNNTWIQRVNACDVKNQKTFIRYQQNQITLHQYMYVSLITMYSFINIRKCHKNVYELKSTFYMYYINVWLYSRAIQTPIITIKGIDCIRLKVNQYSSSSSGLQYLNWFELVWLFSIAWLKMLKCFWISN